MIEKIFPAESELCSVASDSVVCSVGGCGRIFSRSPALRLHLVKTHKIIQVNWLGSMIGKTIWCLTLCLKVCLCIHTSFYKYCILLFLVAVLF